MPESHILNDAGFLWTTCAPDIYQNCRQWRDMYQDAGITQEVSRRIEHEISLKIDSRR